MKRNIPDEYQQVTWVGATAASAVCYVDTEYVPNQDTRVIAGFMRTAESSYACAYGIEKPRFTYLKARVDYNLMEKFSVSAIGLNVPVRVDHNRNYITINGKKYGPIAAYEEFTCPDTMYLWVIHGYEQATAQFAGRFYYFRIYDNDILVRDFVPCYRKADGAIGFYCKVTNKLYQPQGTTTYVAKGADVL